MASYLRPRRGTASAASAIVLKKGEIFCEFKNNPATTSGGTSCGAIKLGNGTTSYQSLGYFLNPDTDVVTWAATTAEGQPSDWGTYGGTSATSASQGASYYADLNALVTGSQNKKVLPLIKNLLFKLATGVTKLNSDMYFRTSTYLNTDNTSSIPTGFLANIWPTLESSTVMKATATTTQRIIGTGSGGQNVFILYSKVADNAYGTVILTGYSLAYNWLIGISGNKLEFAIRLIQAF